MRTAVVAVARPGATPSGTALKLARALSSPDDPCTLIWASRHAVYQDAQPPVAGLEVLYANLLDDTPVASLYPEHFPSYPLLRLSEQLAPNLRRFDVVYSLAGGHPAMALLRERRFSTYSRPYVVTLLGNPHDTPLAEEGRASPEPAHWNQQFGERYQAQHSDCLVCLDPLRPEALEAHGWRLPGRVERLSGESSASTWRTLHGDLEESAHRVMSTPRQKRSVATKPSVTVCIAHRDHGLYLPDVLDSLARQTVDTFTVVVVDDGSVTADSVAVFDRMEARYRSRDWTFLRQPHRGPGAARNLAAHQAQSKYLLFLDADDVALPRLIERMLEAAEYSGDDLLVPGSRRRLEGSIEQCSMPTGNDPIENLAHKISGDVTCLVRREVFEGIGGFPERLIAGLEDQALHIRISLSGFASDVVPEILVCVREIPGRFSATTETILDQDTVQRVYAERLNAMQLPMFSTTFQSLLARRQNVQQRLAGLVETLDRRRRLTGGLRLLLLVPYWPYPPHSGAFQRWWETIRYLGNRHEITLVTFVAAGERTTREPLLRHCRSVVVVRHGEPRPTGIGELPKRVQMYQSLLMYRALEQLTKDGFDAAIVEQIFLAPYREVIEAPTMLGEHNIESSILAQAAGQSGTGSLSSRSHGLRAEAEQMRSYENSVWPEFSMRYAVSEVDRREIQRRARVGWTFLVENGTNSALRLRRARSDTGNLLFCGSLEYFPNIDGIRYFLEEIWPILLRANRSLRFTVAGRNPSPDVHALEHHRNVSVVGNPANLRRVAARASLSVVPLRIGSGTRLKILDSMALGLPVVTTSLGCQGLAVVDGEHLMVRDDPSAFADAVLQLLSDRQTWKRLRTNGLRLVEQRYTWERVLDPLDKMLWQLATGT